MSKRDLDTQATQCADLANAVQDVMHGHELGVIVVVLLRLTAMSCFVNGVKREDLETQFKYVMDDVYSNPPGYFEETVQ